MDRRSWTRPFPGQRLAAAVIAAALAGGLILPAAALASGVAPVANADDISLDEDTPTEITLTGTDAEDDTLTFAVDTDPVHGTVDIGLDGTSTYTPDPDFFGDDAFTFTVDDGTSVSDPATVALTVEPVNDVPVCAGPYAGEGDEDTELFGAVTCTDVEDDSLTYELDDPAASGSANVESDGSWTYTPDADFNGDDAFTFTANDGFDASAPATVDLTVDPTQDPPLAADGTATVAEDGSVSITLAGTDPDGDSLTYAIADAPVHGTITAGTGATRTYTPAPGYVGDDGFTFTVSDGTDTSDAATVEITVTAVNDAPVCTGDTSSGDEDTDQSGDLAPLCTDAEGDTLTFAKVAGPAHGTAVVDPDGTWTYTPTHNFNGADSFTFTASDPTASNVATVSITVDAVNDAPICISPVSSSGDEDTDQAGDLAPACTDVDGDPLVFEIVGDPVHGTAAVDPDGTWTYTPELDFTGADSFTFTASDDVDASNVATVAITVTAANDAPICISPVSSSGDEDTDQVGNVATACSDFDGDTLVFEVVTGPENGTVELDPDGSWTYTPDADFNGDDSFTFTASDGTDVSIEVTVLLEVSNVNDAPVCTGVSSSGDEDGGQAGDLAPACTDIEGDTLVFAKVAGPAHGAAVVHPNGTWTYTPGSNFNGDDAFTFTADDGTDVSAPATVDLTVDAVNDAPVCTSPVTSSGAEDTGQAGDLAPACTDADGDTLTFAVATGPAHGAAVVDPDGSWTYTPNLNANGSDSFTFTASDETGASNVATVSITVAAVNDAPVAIDRSITVEMNHFIEILLTGTDAEGSTLAYSVVTEPVHGDLSGAAPNIRYTPDAGYVGPDSFTFRVNDGSLDSAPATVSITVSADATAPVAVAPTVAFGSGRVNESAPLKITWSATDAGVGVKAYEVEASVAGGAWTPVSNGTATSVTKFYPFSKTLLWRVRATDNNDNVSGWILSAAPRTLVAYQGSRPVTHTGAWVTKTSSSHSGTGFRYTTRFGKRIGLSFTGLGVLYVAPRMPTAGHAKVTIDGTTTGVKLGATRVTYGVIVKSRMWSTAGSHSIRVTNDRAGRRTTFDAFIVLK